RVDVLAVLGVGVQALLALALGALAGGADVHHQIRPLDLLGERERAGVQGVGELLVVLGDHTGATAARAVELHQLDVEQRRDLRHRSVQLRGEAAADAAGPVGDLHQPSLPFSVSSPSSPGPTASASSPVFSISGSCPVPASGGAVVLGASPAGAEEPAPSSGPVGSVLVVPSGPGAEAAPSATCASAVSAAPLATPAVTSSSAAASSSPAMYRFSS